MQELRALRMGSILEDGAALAPSNEEAVLGYRDIEGRGGNHADAAAESGGGGAIALADECHRSGGAADPARSLGEKLFEPIDAVLPEAVVLWLVFVSCNPPHTLVINSRQVECKKHGVVIVGIRKD